jgi:response regulator RpfG family c-di-GMP phosphodiesterase
MNDNIDEINRYSNEEIRHQINKFYQELDNNHPNEKIKILYVDDEETNLKSFKALLRRDYDIDIAISAKVAHNMLETKEYDIIITDQRMPETTGTQFLESIIKQHPNPIRILLTGYADIEDVKLAINKGYIFRYMAKPWEFEDMKLTIQTAYEILILRKRHGQLLKDMGKSNFQLEYLLQYKKSTK